MDCVAIFLLPRVIQLLAQTTKRLTNALTFTRHRGDGYDAVLVCRFGQQVLKFGVMHRLQ